MAASLITVLLLFSLLLSASAELQLQLIKEITVRPGDDVVLPCRAPNNVIISAVEWSRSDREKRVFLKTDRHVDPADQDPSYVNRTQLKDDEMKSGELSLILKNVNNNDEGTYECRYEKKTGGRRKRILDFSPNFSFHLHVGAPEKKESLQQITAQPGDDVTLPCRAPNTANITTVEWIRSGLNGTVCTFEGRQITSKHPSYVNRVQLKDDEMKNGELSLILKNVNSNDDGAYVCIYEGEKGADPIKFMSIVYLHVGAGWGLQLGLGLTAAVLAVALLGFIIKMLCDCMNC